MSNTSAILFILIACLAFTYIARADWRWMIALALFATNTYFQLTFKIYTHEVFLVIAIVCGWLVDAGVKKKSLVSEKIPILIYFLTVYIVVHLSWSVIEAIYRGDSGIGTIMRRYVTPLWVLGFGLAYGGSRLGRNPRLALLIIAAALCFRLLCLVLTYYFPAQLVVPGIGLVIPSAAGMLPEDVRNASVPLALIVATFAFSTRSASILFISGVVYFLVLYATLLSGGRVATMQLCLIILAWLILKRKYFVLLLSVATVPLFIAAINIAPNAVEKLDPGVQRALSSFVFSYGAVSAHERTVDSNTYHEELRTIALEKWLESPLSFLVGNPIQQFDETYYSFILGNISIQQTIELSVEAGMYETAFHMILGVQGGVGFVLYLGLLIALVIPPWRYMRGGYHDVTAAGLCFAAVTSILLWLMFGWLSGGYPTWEIVFGLIANSGIREVSRRSLVSMVAPSLRWKDSILLPESFRSRVCSERKSSLNLFESACQGLSVRRGGAFSRENRPGSDHI